MRLIAFGNEARMEGAVQAARRAGWEAAHVRKAEDAENCPGEADAVLLPWPVSFRESVLAGTGVTIAETLKMIPPCRLIAFGKGIQAERLTMAQVWMRPENDEAFLRMNAQLTAEGAVYRAMQREGKALLGSTALVTGFGRIGQELVKRLDALGVFVIVCARNEKQMQQAHDMGAHPMALSGIDEAAAQADVIFNTVPARILGRRTLERIPKGTMLIELASEPYGADPEEAAQLGIEAVLENGVPGRYAPYQAGAALFEALQRALTESGSGREAYA